MSTELKPVEDRYGQVFLTQFYGGTHDGICLQITPATDVPAYISLTKSQAVVLAYAILGWAQGNWPVEDEND